MNGPGASRSFLLPLEMRTRSAAFAGTAGAIDFIYKPIEADVLRSKADVFFELFRQRQQIAAQRDALQAQPRR